jgi:hypothetical protein
MTTHDPNPTTPATNPAAYPTGAVTRDSRDTRDTVPVVVWRTTPDDPDAPAAPDAGDSPLTPRLAHHLVAIYSEIHATVVDFDADDNLRHAAEGAGRRYLAVTDPADLDQLTDQARPAVLIVLRWPRPDITFPERDAHALLHACQRRLADHGSTIIAVTATSAGQPGTTYTEHEQLLLPAARAAGLRHLHDIVPLTAADGRDSFTYATARDSTASDRDKDTDTPRQNASTTLLIFGHPGRRP